MVFLPSLSQLFPRLNRETCRWGYVDACRQLRAVRSFAGSATNVLSLLLESSYEGRVPAGSDKTE